MSHLPAFARLKFGEAAAENEAEKNPELLLKSFYDPWEAEQKILDGDAFLLIGPKGVGKSTVVHYLNLKSQENGFDTFVRIADLSNLQRQQTINRKPASGDYADEWRTELAWTVYLWLNIFSSLMEDQGSSISRDPDFVQLFNKLQRVGLISGDFRDVAVEVRKRTHKISVPGKLYEFQSESQNDGYVYASQLADVLSAGVLASTSTSLHVLALDGLDSAFIGGESYWNTLANLLRASNTVHKQLRRGSTKMRIVILCRSDVFLRIPLPDSNKIRQDWGVELKWNYGSDKAEDSFLWDLIEHKVRAGGASVSSILDYFPSHMEYGRGRRRAMPEYLMQLTRQTPRDIITLFKTIAEAAPRTNKLNIPMIRAGVNDYCKNYFAGEISNELTGLLPSSVATSVIGSLGRLKRRFTRDQFGDVFSEKISGTGVTIDDLLQQLFLAGAIANIHPGRNEDYVQFYHRRSHSELNVRGPFLIHSALALGLNIPFGGPRAGDSSAFP